MYNKILFPVDLNEAASWSKALPTALTLCRSFGASLHVVTVLPDVQMPLVGGFFPSDYASRAREAVSNAQHDFIRENVPDDIQVQSVIVEGSPWEAIIEASSQVEADLIVMASHTKRKFVDYVLGPNAEHVVHHSKVSVMVVR
ncbi:universal stress protein [Halomonas halmophila]|uniref:Universal stress protein UspA n=1 Tax=Halomonas halmophila TaxID=252 RepID=A0A4Y4F1U3_9GAMM|nr:universal stress protein [Halomonas halmophila]GED21128.1 universal stress protein UspA [Halomonas halmophila]